MAGIAKKSFDDPDDTIETEHGRMKVVRVEDQDVWRSEFTPGWSWDDDLSPLAGGVGSCQLTHREYVVAGRIRYVMDDGSETVGEPGDYLLIRPGHRGWVVGDANCVLIDW